MASTLMATADVEALVQSQLPDSALEIYVDAADSKIVEIAGPHDGPRVQYETFYDTGVNSPGLRIPETFLGKVRAEYVYLQAPARTVGEVLVWEYGQTEDDARTLAATEYRLEHGGRALRRVSSWWETHIKVTFTPKETNAQRRQALVQLVKLAVAFDGFSMRQVSADISRPADYAKEQARILRSLQPTYAGAGLLA